MSQVIWVGNVDGASGPYRLPLKFKAGATQAIKVGEFLELSAGDFVPLGSDKAMSATIAVSDEAVEVGDLAGYRYGIVPRVGDLFAVELSAPGAPAIGASVYWASSQTVALTGSNALGKVHSYEGVPIQGKNSLGQPDQGATLRNVRTVIIRITPAASYYAAL